MMLYIEGTPLALGFLYPSTLIKNEPRLLMKTEPPPSLFLSLL